MADAEFDLNKASRQVLIETLKIDADTADEIFAIRAVVPFTALEDLEELITLSPERLPDIAAIAGLARASEDEPPIDQVAESVYYLADVVKSEIAALVKQEDDGAAPRGPTQTRPPGGGWVVDPPQPPQPPAPPPGPNDPRPPQPKPPPQPPRPPEGDYIWDQEKDQFIRPRPGRPRPWTQNHLGANYGFSVTVRANRRGNMTSVTIISTQPGGARRKINKRRNEDIESVVKNGPMITITTDKRTLTYDGRLPISRTNPVTSRP